MSHYTVMVVGDGDLEEMLAPFEESPEDKRLLVFEDVEEEKRKFYENEKREFVKLEDGTVLSKYDSRFRVQTGLVSHEYQWPENSLVELPLKEAYPTFEAFMEDWGEERDEESGKWGYWHNPRAKWDWWQVGGRWTGFFKAKPGVESEQGTPGLMTPHAGVGYADRIRKGDIDFEGMRDEACKKAFERYDRFVRLVGLPPGTDPWVMAPWKTWEQVIEENPEAEREELGAIYFSQDVLQRLEKAKQNRDALDEDLRDAVIWLDADSFAMTQDQYVLNARNAALATFAMLKDGEWYERGKMGWWGMVSDENSEWLARFNELLDSLPDDTLLTVVDCHI